MQPTRRTWPAILLLLASLSLGLRSVAADIDTLRQGSAPAEEALRYLFGDALVASASAVALLGTTTVRPWAPRAMMTWLVILLTDVAWVLFVAIGSDGPPMSLRLGAWLATGSLGALAVYWVRRAWTESADRTPTPTTTTGRVT
jgi:hypothetical protein